MLYIPYTAEGYKKASLVNGEAPASLLSSDFGGVTFRTVGSGKKNGKFMHATGWINLFEESLLPDLHENFGDCAAILPVQVEERTWYVIRPAQVVDCLDVKKSKILWSSDGRGLMCEEATFRQEAITGHRCLLLPQFLNGPLLIEESASRRLKSLQIPGLYLIPATSW